MFTYQAQVNLHSADNNWFGKSQHQELVPVSNIVSSGDVLNGVLLFAKCKCVCCLQLFLVLTNEFKGTTVEGTHYIKGLDSQVFRLWWFQFWIQDPRWCHFITIRIRTWNTTDILFLKHLKLLLHWLNFIASLYFKCRSLHLAKL